MKMGKVALMSGVAAIAMTVGAQAANTTANKAADSSNTISQADRPLVLAQNFSQPSIQSNAELAARVQALEDAQAAQADRASADRTRLSTLEQGYNSAVWTFDNGRPSLASGDGRFTFNVRMRFQTDYASFMQDDTHPAGFNGPNDLGSGAVMRRAYIGFDGKVYKDFAYDVRFNFGGSNGGGAGVGEGDPLLNRFYLSYIGIPNWHFSVGVLEPVFAGELSQSSSALPFIERTEIDNIASQYGAGDTRRGIEIGWSKTDTLWTGDHLAITGSFTGGTTGSSIGHGSGTGTAPGGDEQSQAIVRVSERLWTNGLSNIQIGGNYGKLIYTGGTGAGGGFVNLQDRPQMRVDGTRLISTGNIAAKTGDMFSFDAQGNLDNFYMAGEWAKFSLDRQCGAAPTGGFTAGNCFGGSSLTVADRPSFEGFYVEGTWILTGETKPYTTQAINNEVGAFGNPVPSRPFSLDGDSWGAWELTARYSDMDLNYNQTQVANAVQLAGITGGEERIITLGVNWYLNRNIKLQVNDMIVKVNRGIATNVNRDSQDLNILGVRLAFAN
jgi:phosphate-selective porin OprO/OprP